MMIKLSVLYGINYEIDDEGKRVEYENPYSLNFFLLLYFFSPSNEGEAERKNLLTVRAYIMGATDVMSPEGYWIFTSSTIKEVLYRVSPGPKEVDNN